MTVARLSLLVLLVIAITAVNQWEILDRILIAFVAWLVLAYAWSRWSLSGVGIRWRTDSDRAQVGQVLTGSVTVVNNGMLPKLWIEVRDHSNLPGHYASRVIRMRGQRELTWTTSTPCLKRGRHQIGPMSLRSGDPFGIFPVSRTVANTIEVLIYPMKFDLPRFVIPAGTLTGSAATERRTAFVTPSVSGIREYSPGDAFNRISWSTTARLGRLMVKEFDIDPTSDVWLVLDLDRNARARVSPHTTENRFEPLNPMRWLDSTEEYAVAVTASLAEKCLQDGRGVGLIATGAHREIIAAERSERTRGKMLETLAVVTADGHEPLAEVLIAEWRRFTRNSGLIVVTSSAETGWIDALTHISERRIHVAVVYIDGGSFDGSARESPSFSTLAGRGIPAYRVEYGSDIPNALAFRGVN